MDIATIFFDKYDRIRATITDKIRRLPSYSSPEKFSLRTAHIGFDGRFYFPSGYRCLSSEHRKIVIIASACGGSGSGMFLDMGYLAGALSHACCLDAQVDLVLMLLAATKVPA